MRYYIEYPTWVFISILDNSNVQMAFSMPTLNLFAGADQRLWFQDGGSGKIEFLSKMLVKGEGEEKD